MRGKAMMGEEIKEGWEGKCFREKKRGLGGGMALGKKKCAKK